MIERKCHWQGCDSGARWGVELHFECQGTDERRLLKFKSSLECCDVHKGQVKPWVLSDANREQITTTMMERGYPEPNYLTAVIEFVPVGRDPMVVIEPCNREGCTKHAKWRVIQVIPHLTKPGEKARLTTNLAVCDEHKAVTKPADLLDPESKAATHKALRKLGVTLHSLNRMRLEFEPVSAAAE